MSGARGRYYDGLTSQARDVSLTAEGGTLVLRGEGVERRVEAARLEVSEPDAGGLRVLRFRDGGACEVEEDPALRALLGALGHREPEVVGWQSSWAVVAIAVALLAVGAAGAYRSGLPWLAERVAKGLPEAVHERIGAETLALLDRASFSPSALPPERQAELTTRFRALRAPGGAMPAHAIHFRAGGALGANALALPNGDVVVTDELVALAEDDTEVLAVLAHELGHLRERHGLRIFLQGSVVGIATGLYLGDVGTVLASAPAFLLQAKYSRDFERQADAYAATLLRANDIPPARLGTILRKLDAAARGDGQEDAEEREGGGTGRGGGLAYLSSHPLTAERVEALGE